MNESAVDDPSEKRRRRLKAVLLLLSLMAVAAFDALSTHDQWRLVEWVRVGVIALLALVVSLRSTTNFRLGARVPALDDELTRANRASAATWGFWALLLAAAAAFAASFFLTLTLAEAALALTVIGPAVAAMRFLALEHA